jgi:hypothetical protein
MQRMLQNEITCAQFMVWSMRFALGDDGHGNTITFGQLRGLHIHQPTLDPRDESRVEAVAVAKTETLLAIHHFASVVGEGEDPLTTAKAQGRVERALKGYSAAL